jgi:branched-chain amino acid transport system permease protein
MNLDWGDITAQLLVFFVLATSLNFVIGFAKTLSIHHAALFAIGAFTYANFATRGWSEDLIVAIAAAGILGAGISVLLALGSLRVAGDYFIVASFAFQLLAVSVLYNWTAVSGGNYGLFGLAAPTFAGVPIEGVNGFIVLFALLALITLAFSIWLRRGPYGRIVRAMGESPSALATAGFGELRLKTGIFVMSGVLAATAGAMYASYLGIAQTGSFGVDVSILVAAMVVIGGVGSAVGSLLGAALVVISQPLLSTLDISTETSAALRQLFFGLTLVVVVTVLPRGLVQLGDLGRRLVPGRVGGAR